jgi:predicted signal transduction protein with EAL and GGDEF domain
MVRLCHDLGLSVTAEGVERPSQLAMLTALGGVDVQGYLIARPQPIDVLAVQLPELGEKVRTLSAAAGQPNSMSPVISALPARASAPSRLSNRSRNPP